MSVFRRLFGSLHGRSSRDPGIRVGDRYQKHDGQYRSVWTVHQIVHFDGIPPHARLIPDQEFHLGYRTISVVALDDPDFYRRMPASGSGGSSSGGGG